MINAVHPSPGLRGDRLLERNIFLALQALRGQLEDPAKDHRGDKAERESDNQPAQRPTRSVKRRLQSTRNLSQQPCADEIEPRPCEIRYAASARRRGCASSLCFPFAEFLEARIIPERIEHRIET